MLEDTITDVVVALEKSWPVVHELGAGEWALESSPRRSRKTQSAHASLSDEWLRLDATVETAADPEQLWSLLASSAAPDGLCKLALSEANADGETRVCLIADIALGGGDLSGLAMAISNEFRETLTRLQSGEINKAASTEPSGVVLETPWILQICEQAGWIGRERSSGRVEVKAGGEGSTFRVELESNDRVTLRVSSSPACLEGWSSESRLALEVFSLRVNAAVRLARASVEESNGTTCFRTEVCFGAAPTSTELDLALSALAVAWGSSHREVAALQDPELARQYLVLTSSFIQQPIEKRR